MIKLVATMIEATGVLCADFVQIITLCFDAVVGLSVSGGGGLIKLIESLVSVLSA